MSGEQKTLKVKGVPTLQVIVPVVSCQSLEDRRTVYGRIYEILQSLYTVK